MEEFVFFTKYRSSPIPAGGFEITLMLSFKSRRYLTQQKIKNVLAQLYCLNFEAKNDNEIEVQNKEVIKITRGGWG